MQPALDDMCIARGNGLVNLVLGRPPCLDDGYSYTF